MSLPLALKIKLSLPSQKTKIPPRPYLSWAVFASLYFLLLVAFVKFLYKLARVYDVRFYDESNVLSSGINFVFTRDLFNEFAAYQIWYWFLSLFITDPVKLFIYNYGILVCLGTIALLVYMVRKSKFHLISIVVAIAFLTYSPHISAHPNAPRFALLIVFGCLILCDIFQKKSYYFLRWGTVYAGALLLLYTRVEHILTNMLCMSVAMYWAYQKLRHKQWLKATFHWLCLAIIAFCVFFKYPGTAGRSIGAFATWYTYNKTLQKETIKGDPWYDWELTFQKGFGDSQNLWSAFFHNPSEFFSHISFNFFVLQKKLINDSYIVFLALAVLMILLLYAFRRPQVSAMPIRQGTYLSYWREIILKIFSQTIENPERVFLIGISGTILTSIIVMQYHMPYALVLTSLYFAFCGITLAKYVDIQVNTKAQGIVFFILVWLLIAFIPWHSSGLHSLTPGAPHNRLPTCSSRSVIKFLEVLPWQRGKQGEEAVSHKFLYDGNPSFYLKVPGAEFRDIYFHSKKQPFVDFLAENKFSLVHINNHVKSHRAYQNDSGFLAFMKNPSKYGFLKKERQDCSEYWLIKETQLVK